MNAIDRGSTITRQSLPQMLVGDPNAITRKPREGLGPERISIARLPVTGSDIFGREEDGTLRDYHAAAGCRYSRARNFLNDTHALAMAITFAAVLNYYEFPGWSENGTLIRQPCHSGQD
jgi:hypothetical protein